jgi:putative membrane protein
MTHRPRPKLIVATVALGLLVGSAAPAAPTRLPWAATSGFHFIHEIVAADNFRAAAGGLAIKKSPSPDVREFGRMLWQGSIANTRRLKWSLTHADPYVVLPERVSPRYMFVIDELVFANDDAFDRRFIAQQTASLRQTLALTQAYARYGDDFELKEYAARSLPAIQLQLDLVIEIGTRHAP